ncbi:hypothetical protein LJC72_03085 [Bacteroides sp. OttesenSCG-928-D19]|nr:hypothetical protein [Bacteroides sp. OttesenSCG-928-D19]
MQQTFLYTLIVLFVLQACGDNNMAEEKSRRTTDFNTGWRFMLGDNPRASVESFDDASWQELNFPHDWIIKADAPGEIGWYRKTFTPPVTDKGKQTYIEFNGFYLNSIAWINGQLLDEAPRENTSFRYNLTPHLRYGQKNTIALRVDNGWQRASHRQSDSCINHSVRLVTVHPLHIAHCGTCVTTENVSAQSAGIILRVTLENTTQKMYNAELISVVKDADGKVKAKVASLVSIQKEGQKETVQAMTLENPQLWSDAKPYMYTITTQVVADGRVIDEYDTPLSVCSVDLAGFPKENY